MENQSKKSINTANITNIEYRRYFQLLDMFVNEGSIFLMHPQILYFGEYDKRHYAVSKYNLQFGCTYSIFNPCTSQEKNKKRKDIFAFSLKDGSTLQENTNKTTYVLLSLNSKVKLTDLMKPDSCVYKGKMLNDTLEGYRKAKKEFVESKQNKRKAT